MDGIKQTDGKKASMNLIVVYLIWADLDSYEEFTEKKQINPRFMKSSNILKELFR